MKRILPSKRIRKEIDELLKEGTKGDLLDRCGHIALKGFL
jgi:hypothetical protein